MSDLHEVSRQMLAHQRKMDIARRLSRKWLTRPITAAAAVTVLSRKTNTGIELTLMLGGRRG